MNADLDEKFINSMYEFKGETTQCLTNIEKTLERIDEERKAHSKEYWEKLNGLVGSIHTETEERMKEDNKLEVCLKVVKDRQNNADKKAGLIGGTVGSILVVFKMVFDWMQGK